jgi:hypothetical protein
MTDQSTGHNRAEATRPVRHTVQSGQHTVQFYPLHYATDYSNGERCQRIASSSMSGTWYGRSREGSLSRRNASVSARALSDR